MKLLPVSDPNWVNHCLCLIIGAEADEVNEMKEQALAALLRPVNEVEPD